MYRATNRAFGRTSLASGVALMALCTAVVSEDGSVSEASTSSCITAIEGRFIESAPRDRFEFVNRSVGGWSIVRITLDLEASTGSLIFDTADGGPGVEVFQPYRVEQGTAAISRATEPGDGDKVIVFDFDAFAPGDSFVFSIDVDDQLVDSALGQIRVAGSEIRMASVTTVFVDTGGQRQTNIATFDAQARVTTDC